MEIKKHGEYKPIDEMRHLADEMGKAISTECVKRYLEDERKLEAVLRENGWRKASEVALEVIGKIEKIIDKHYNKHIFGNNDLDDLEHEAIINFSDDVTSDIYELKKKYTEGE